jgi:lipopolysaccharide/colanic/teichoic acid biosynthesis glycosyltransferase
VGKDGKEFCCIKLRSMCVDAEKNGAQFACKNDPRAFPWGKTIRDKKIDELIQIWNVLKGEMHFVGPRPERKIWTKEFEKSIPFYNQRHVVAPGITGWAQIKYQYGSGKLDAQQKLSYDLYYIKHWSLKFELEIIWKTALFILTKRRENLSNF